MLSWKDLIIAANSLSPAAFKLFLYLSKNQDGYKNYFSPTDFLNSFNMTERSYRNAKQELIEKGYLRKEEDVTIFSTKKDMYSAEYYKEKILDMTKQLEVLNIQAYNDFKKYLADKNLKQYKENVSEDVYIFTLKEIFEYVCTLVEEYSPVKMENLL